MSEAERRRVVVGVSGSLGSLAALHRGAAEAHRRGAGLVAVGAWEPPRGALTHPSSMLAPPVAEFRELAAERLRAALDTAFGGAGPGVPLRVVAVWDRPGRALVRVADRAGDLLVIGAGRRGRVHRALLPRWRATASRTPPVRCWPCPAPRCTANSPRCGAGSAYACR